MNDLDQKIANGVLDFYGYSFKNILDEVIKSKNRRLNFFYKKKGQINQLKDEVNLSTYVENNEIGQGLSDIVFLDQDAVKGIFNNYPPHCKYVLVNCLTAKYVFWIFFGLLRRIMLRKVRCLGVKKLHQNGNSSFWLVLVRNESKKGHEFRLSSSIGIEGFLKYLHEANVDYVIPRHFDQLPALHRPGGDLDLLVSDTHEELIKDFLIENTGSLRVDVWSVSRKNYNGITYMPSHLTQKVIENSIAGPALAKIPNDEDAFKCLVFHLLYHKGFMRRSNSTSEESTEASDADRYISLLKKYGGKINIDIEYNMASMDEYMKSVGWRPTRNILSKIAKWNEWVRVYHFNKKS